MKKQQKTTRKIFKKRPCRMCRNKIDEVKYTDVDLLSNYISDRGKIVPSRLSGNCTRHQRLIANRIKRARLAGLLPFVKVKQGAGRERNSYRRR